MRYLNKAEIMNATHARMSESTSAISRTRKAVCSLVKLCVNLNNGILSEFTKTVFRPSGVDKGSSNPESVNSTLKLIYYRGI